MREAGQICYGTVTPPEPDCTGVPVLISDEVMEKRCAAVMARMEEENLDSLVVYGDLEHGQNFAYLTGFLPRFEEALLVLNRNGHHTMLMGNENLNKVSCARIKAQAVHVPFFSLPNQPMIGECSLTDCFQKAGLKSGSRIGIAGWKHFTSRILDNRQLFDVPFYIVEAVREIAGTDGTVGNAADVFIGNKGVRCINTANELAHYEFLHILAVHGRDILGSKSWSEALYKKFLMYKKYEGFFRHLYESDDNEHFRRTNRRFVRDAYTMMLRHYGVDVHDPHIQFAVEMVVYGGEEMTMRWMMDGMKVPIEVMLVLFQESIPVSISQYFY